MPNPATPKTTLAGSGEPARTTAGRRIPLSLAQQATLLPERLRHIPAVNLFTALEFSGGLDAAALDHAAIALLARHEILRISYPDDRRVPYQQMLPVPTSIVEQVRLDSAGDLGAALRADAGHRFNLAGSIDRKSVV